MPQRTDNFVSYSNAQAIVAKIAAKLNAINGAYIFKGSYAFAEIPATPTKAMVGFTYDITNEFTTDNRFLHPGREYSAGTNISIVDVSVYGYVAVVDPEGNPKEEGWYEYDSINEQYVLTNDEEVASGKTYYEYKVTTPVFKYDVNSAFVNVDAIQTRINTVAQDITNNVWNAASPAGYNAGDLVLKNDVLYRFKLDGQGHTAGEPWDDNEVDLVTVEDLIIEIGGGAGDLALRLNNFEAAIAAPFSDSANYEIGDVVRYGDGFYVFTAVHNQQPWSGLDVNATTFEAYIISLINALGEDINDRIDDVIDIIADAFDPDKVGGYAIGDVVTHEDKLYKFTSAHTEGDPWSSLEVTEITSLAAYTDSLNAATNIRVDTVRNNFADIYDPAQSYSKGAFVLHGDVLYEITDNGGMTGAWDSNKATAVTVDAIIDAVKPIPLDQTMVENLTSLIND